MRTVRRHYRAITIIAAVALAVFLLGCASFGGARHIATVSVVSAHGVLSFLQDGEALLVCGKAGAPAAPQCVPPDLHRQIAGELVTAFDLDERVARLAKTANTDTIPSLLGQIDDIIARIMRLLPSSPQKDKLVTKMIGS